MNTLKAFLMRCLRIFVYSVWLAFFLSPPFFVHTNINWNNKESQKRASGKKGSPKKPNRAEIKYPQLNHPSMHRWKNPKALNFRYFHSISTRNICILLSRDFCVFKLSMVSHKLADKNKSIRPNRQLNKLIETQMPFQSIWVLPASRCPIQIDRIAHRARVERGESDREIANFYHKYWWCGMTQQKKKRMNEGKKAIHVWTWIE